MHRNLGLADCAASLVPPASSSGGKATKLCIASFGSVKDFLDEFRQTSWTCHPCPSEVLGPIDDLSHLRTQRQYSHWSTHQGLEVEQKSHSVSDVPIRLRRNTTSRYGLLCTDQRSRIIAYAPVTGRWRDFNSTGNQIWPGGHAVNALD